MSPGELLVPICWVLLIHLAGWGAGSWLYERLTARGAQSKSVRVFVSSVLGFIVLAHIALLLGLLHLSLCIDTRLGSHRSGRGWRCPNLARGDAFCVGSRSLDAAVLGGHAAPARRSLRV